MTNLLYCSYFSQSDGLILICFYRLMDKCYYVNHSSATVNRDTNEKKSNEIVEEMH